MGQHLIPMCYEINIKNYPWPNKRSYAAFQMTVRDLRKHIKFEINFFSSFSKPIRFIGKWTNKKMRLKMLRSVDRFYVQKFGACFIKSRLLSFYLENFFSFFLRILCSRHFSVYSFPFGILFNTFDYYFGNIYLTFRMKHRY